jgi:thiol-disulfide isomerase/thioredoxin
MNYGLSHLLRARQTIALLSLTLIVLFSAGCRQGEQAGTDDSQPQFEVAGEEDAAPSAGKVADRDSMLPPFGSGAPDQPPPLTSDQLGGTSDVPDGSPEELLAYISDLDRQLMQLARQGPPAVGAQSAVIAQRTALFENKLAAAERIIEAPDTDVATRRQAIEAKLQSMANLRQLDPNQPWGERVSAFAKQLAADPDPDIARQGRTILFSLRVGDVAMNQDADFAAFLSELEALLADEGRGQDAIDVAQYAAFALSRLGQEDRSRQAMQMIVDAFEDHADPELAAQANNIVDQLRLMDLGLDEKLQAVVENQPGADEALLEAVTQALEASDLGPVVLQEFVRLNPSQPGSLLEMLEQTGHYELGAQIGQRVQDAFADVEDENLKVMAMQGTEAILRRLSLVGKPLELRGQKLDGSPFDLDPYQGKVVLVDFWASWCGPCVEEIPNIVDAYQKYQAKGFEVIGVNLDQSPQAAQNFLDNHEVPWENLIGSELAEEFGVETIPFVLLTDQNGVVIDLHVRGRQLEEKLRELLGPPDATAPSTAADEPGTPLESLP